MAGITRVGAKVPSVKSLFESVIKANSASLQTSSRNVQATTEHGQQSALKEEGEGRPWRCVISLTPLLGVAFPKELGLILLSY